MFKTCIMVDAVMAGSEKGEARQNI